MPSLAQLAEVSKLARTLSVPEASVHFAARLDPRVVRALRARLTALYFDSDRHTLQRIGKASTLVPAGAAAAVAEHALGVLLCARVCGVVPPDRAVEVASRLGTRFIADVCVQLDPRQAAHIIAAMPRARVLEISRELWQREELVTMGRFVGSLPADAIVDVIASMDDDRTLLRIAFYIEEPAALASVLGLLPEARLRSIVTGVTRADPALWPEVLTLVTALEPAWRARLADLALDEGEALVATLVDATRRFDLWQGLFTVVQALSPERRAALCASPTLSARATLEHLLASVEREGLWAQGREVIALIVALGTPEAASLLASLRALAAPDAAARLGL